MSHTPDQPDKGYTTGFYDGKQAEQDRIVGLLEDYGREKRPFLKSIIALTVSKLAIALIKGEK